MIYRDWFPALSRHICLTQRELMKTCRSKRAATEAIQRTDPTGFVCDGLSQADWVTVAWVTVTQRRLWAVLSTSYSLAPYPQEIAPTLFCRPDRDTGADLARALRLGIRLPASVTRLEWHPHRNECYVWVPEGASGFVCTQMGRETVDYLAWKLTQ